MTALSPSSPAARLAFLLPDLLRRLGGGEPDAATLDGVAAALRDAAGCDAASFRLAALDDFPFHRATGYTDAFLARESALRDGLPAPAAGGAAAPRLACLCGAMLEGRLRDAADRPLASLAVASLSDVFAGRAPGLPEDAHGGCLADGFESLLLAPVRAGGETFGLLHLADRRRAFFTDDLRAGIEGIASALALFIAARRRETLAREEAARARCALGLQTALVEANDLLRAGETLDVIARHFDAALFVTTCSAFAAWTIDRRGEGAEPLHIRGGLSLEAVIPHLDPRSPRVRPLPASPGGAPRLAAAVVAPGGICGCLAAEPSAGSCADIAARLESAAAFFATAICHRRALDELEAARRDLEARVIDRTRELAVTNLRLGREILELQRAEREIRKLSLAIEQSPSLVVITDIEGRIEYANPRYTEVTGYPLDEVKGRYVGFHREEIVNWDVPRSAADETAGRTEFRCTRKDGGEWIEDSYMFPLRDATGEITNYIVVGEDVTERRAMERAFLHRERIAAIGDLAASVAHELNNPLGIIHGYADLMRGKPDLPESARRNLALIFEQTDRARRIVAGLLEFARARPATLAPVDLADACRRAHALVEAALGKSGVSFELEAPAEPVFALADAHGLQQVLVNLFNNAAQAMEPGGGRILVAVDRAGDRARLRVRDTGPGIPPEIRPKLFTPYFTTKASGTGIGLSICRRILDGMKGEIGHADPAEGPGSVFVVTLPETPPPG